YEEYEILRYLNRHLRWVKKRKLSRTKLTRKEIRKNLSGTDLEGYENLTESDVKGMTDEECEAKMLMVLSHVFKDVDCIEDLPTDIDTSSVTESEEDQRS
ncbi:unnamed protein product, partial [Allacma fusca]